MFYKKMYQFGNVLSVSLQAQLLWALVSIS